MPDNRPSDLMPAGSINPNLMKVALRLLWRDWQGGELRLLFIALVMAVTSVTGIAMFTDRLERALLLESANMLAADRIVSGRGELPEAVLAEGQSRVCAPHKPSLSPQWFFRTRATCWSQLKR